MTEIRAENGKTILLTESRPNSSQGGMDFEWKTRGFHLEEIEKDFEAYLERL